MLTWKDIVHFSVKGNPEPPFRVEKSEAEWREILTPEQFRITRKKGTEAPHTGALCGVYEAGEYDCACCNAPLFDSTIKFESGTGWPSFTQPVAENAIKYEKDQTFGMIRIEVLCNACDAHLGHVFPDGPEPSGLRYCINSEAIHLRPGPEKRTIRDKKLEMATLGGGCFWCTEAVFQEIKGVEKAVSGYSGGTAPGKPTYREVCSGLTGHAEVVQITFNAHTVSYADILAIFMTSHDPTALNRQGADVGTQYRSVIFYHNEGQKKEAETMIAQFSTYYEDPIVTEVSPLDIFYEAEEYHQDYYRNHSEEGYCNVVITPKLAKLRKMHSDKLG